ncbi:hypothetical protein TIFTF001_008553 [Ficus carica]|uniref:Uncharacterized protein n=1 Tax=Ficus carica TaxID=3494 RepID=A0AA88CY22_FICCA|nr:hypothetical protein TIFTF001_008553 [Ficus carica]
MPVEIEAPNLVSFTNKGSLQADSSPSLALIFPNINEVYLELDSNLMDFIRFFGHCKTLSMFLTEPALEELAYPKQQRRTIITSTPVLYAVNHLEITAQFRKFSSFVELVDTLLWLAPHPETIYIDDVLSNNRLGTEPKLSKIKLHYGTSASGSKAEAEDCETCCTLFPTAKCWRHCLTEVTLEEFNKYIHPKLHDFFMENASQLSKITVL